MASVGIVCMDCGLCEGFKPLAWHLFPSVCFLPLKVTKGQHAFPSALCSGLFAIDLSCRLFWSETPKLVLVSTLLYMISSQRKHGFASALPDAACTRP